MLHSCADTDVEYVEGDVGTIELVKYDITQILYGFTSQTLHTNIYSL